MTPMGEVGDADRRLLPRPTWSEGLARADLQARLPTESERTNLVPPTPRSRARALDATGLRSPISFFRNDR